MAPQKTESNPSVEQSHPKAIQKAPTWQKNMVLTSFVQVFKIFCRETSLHGVNHIVGSKAEFVNYRWRKKLAVKISRVIWTGICIFGLVFALIMMKLIWTRFQMTPTITTIDTTNHPIWEVPFPSVTICNINKVYGPNTENITNILLSQGIAINTILLFFESLSNLIQPESVSQEFVNISIFLQDIGYNTERLMLDLAHPCEKMLKTCSWLGNTVPCQDVFKMSKSSEGLCCSFNYEALRPSLEVDQEVGLPGKIHYVSGAGRNMGLNVLLDVEKENAMSMSKSFYGVEVLIHGSEEFPQASVTSAVAQPGQETIMSIVPSVMSTKSNLRTTPFVERQCYFEDEIRLRATRKYNVNSCIAECRVDYIVEMCQCVPFFYPDIPILNSRLRQCDLRDVTCLREYRTFFASLQPPDGTTGFNSSNKIGMNCNCFPSCDELTYQVTTISSQRNYIVRSPKYQRDLSNLTTIHVYFRDLTCIRYRRDMYMTWDGLLASFGGIFGLCLGGSIISIVEMVYFFTIKLGLTIAAKFERKRKIISPAQKHEEHSSSKPRSVYTVSSCVPRTANKSTNVAF